MHPMRERTASVHLRCKLHNWRYMAMGDIPNNGPGRRLNSWKEIADYLWRDVRTAIRWESQGLPVHRIPGGKGTSVFAFSNEIDAWMSGRQQDPQTTGPTPEIPLQAAAPLPARRHSTARVAAVAVTTVLAVSLAAVGFVVRGKAAVVDLASLTITPTATEISVAVGADAPRVVYKFQPDSAIFIKGTPVRATRLHGDHTVDLLAGIAFYNDHHARLSRTGELLDLSLGGDVRWRFPIDDVLTFRDGTFRGPWALAAWESIADAPRSRIAVAAHDYVWWASMVTVLDDSGRRQGTFVNPGWIESLLWVGSSRLAVGGFNNQRNEAMFAMIDPAAANGQAPGTAGTEFGCANCSSTPPLFYVTFPRSELNLLTGSPFNGARVSRVGDRLMVTTSEIGSSPATAIYEFSADLRFVRARFSEPYWDEHSRLEREGKLTHTREKCPHRDGPRVMHIWDAARGQWNAR